jgi:hypothetical protein
MWGGVTDLLVALPPPSLPSHQSSLSWMLLRMASTACARHRGTSGTVSVLRSGSVRFFAPKTRNRGLQPVQDQPRYWGDRTGPPRTGLLRSTQPKKTSLDRFFGVIFVVPIEIIFISTIITLKIRRNI